MALFGFRKKEEEKSVSSCACGGKAVEKVTENMDCCGEAVNGICCIKVLGSGCKSCHALYKATVEAVRNKGLDIDVEYVTDMEKIMEYAVMSLPALVVNENVVSMGRVLNADQIERILEKY